MVRPGKPGPDNATVQSSDERLFLRDGVLGTSARRQDRSGSAAHRAIRPAGPVAALQKPGLRTHATTCRARLPDRGSCRRRGQAGLEPRPPVCGTPWRGRAGAVGAREHALRVQQDPARAGLSAERHAHCETGDPGCHIRAAARREAADRHPHDAAAAGDGPGSGRTAQQADRPGSLHQPAHRREPSRRRDGQDRVEIASGTGTDGTLRRAGGAAIVDPDRRREFGSARSARVLLVRRRVANRPGHSVYRSAWGARNRSGNRPSA